MSRRTFVTGYLEYAEAPVNPSALVAASLQRRFELLEVAYAAVDEFIERLAAESERFDRLLMLGVQPKGTKIELERRARNAIGLLPDARGEVRGPGPIEVNGPAELASTLFGDVPAAHYSNDCGAYLCNYLSYRALRLLPDKRVGFVHVPPAEVMPLDAQRAEILRLLDAIESHGSAATPPR